MKQQLIDLGLKAGGVAVIVADKVLDGADNLLDKATEKYGSPDDSEDETDEGTTPDPTPEEAVEQPPQQQGRSGDLFTFDDFLLICLLLAVMAGFAIFAGGPIGKLMNPSGDSYTIESKSSHSLASKKGYAPLSDISQQHLDAYRQGQQSGKAQATPESFCDNTEGGMPVNQPVLMDPDTGTCYVGSQITAHLAEVQAEKVREATELKKAKVALEKWAADRGVKADDSWRELAVEFARRPTILQAAIAAEQVYTAHGGTSDEFRRDLDNARARATGSSAVPDKTPACQVTNIRQDANGEYTWNYELPLGAKACQGEPPKLP